jgi:hypothetical protein
VGLVAGHDLKGAGHVQSPRQGVLGEPLAAVQGYKIVETKVVPHVYMFGGVVGRERQVVMIFPTFEEEALGISVFHRPGSLEYWS